MKKERLSIVVPCYNEQSNVEHFYRILKNSLKSLDLDHRIIYVNDGSKDRTLEFLHAIAKHDKKVTVISLSRNFGKEIATSVGIVHSNSDAILMVDGDGQHPVELIPNFIEKWRTGSQVVVGVRESNQKEGLIKKYGSKVFYILFKLITGKSLVAGSTDFRLIDKVVGQEFARLTERNRITRGLIDWLGFKTDTIPFQANARMAGEASYSFRKLFELALNSFVSLSAKPLYFAFYIGMLVLPLSVLAGIIVVLEMLVGDPLGWNARASAYLIIFAIALIGLILISQGITALYLSHIYTEAQNRPLYIIDEKQSRNFSV